MPLTPGLTDRIAARVAERGIGGLVWALALDDDVATGALGWRDPVGETTPMSVDTLFRIASVTKPIVGALAMRLWESGAIGMDEPVATWLPELADVRVLRDADGPWDGPTEALHRPITVRDVLELRTGWGMAFGQTEQPHLLRLWELGIGPGVTTAERSADELVARLATVPLAEQPGTRWRYDVASDLLGVLLERATGEPLDVLLRREILELVGMTETAFWVEGDDVGRLSESSGADDGGPRVVWDPPDGRWSRRPAMFSGGAGLVSSAADLVAFGRMLARGGTVRGTRVLGADVVREMTTDRLTRDQRQEAALDHMGWGLGIGVRAEDTARGWPTVGCLSWDGGLGSRLLIDPGRDLVLVVLATDFFESPGMPAVLDDITSEVADLLLEDGAIVGA